MKINIVKVGILATTLLIIACFSGYSQRTDPKTTDQKFISALQAIRFAYVDTVNEAKIVEKAIIEMLKELDPHSRYFTAKEIKEANEPLMGNFEGIGVQFNILKDTIVVITPVPGGPSEKLGIMSGDKIIKIDGEEATGKKVTNTFVVSKLRGEKGSKVTVSILRRGRKSLLDFTIVRDKIPIHSVVSHYMATPDVGYIKLAQFSRTTMQEISMAMLELKAKGMKNLILDLTGNSGGFLDVAIDLSDEFLDGDKLIVYTEGNRSPVQNSTAGKQGSFEKGKLVIMIDEGSASASEIVAGAVQDWDRSLIVGRRSFGKGLVQRPFNLPDGSVIRLTTARYHTPTGRCIQKPYSEGVDAYEKELMKRYKNGEFVNIDSIKFPDSLKYYTPNKRMVYGGGGIMPDFFVPLDTSGVSNYFSAVVRKGLINQYSMEYVDNNRSILMEKYPTVDIYDQKFIIDSVLINKFAQYAEKEGVPRDQAGIDTSYKYLENHLKALIASKIWGYAALIQINNKNDKIFLKALEVLNDNTFKKMMVQYK